MPAVSRALLSGTEQARGRIRWAAMECSKLVGYVASALVFATFYMNSMTMLRVLTLISNVAFIAYACLGELFPILALHVALLPLNAWRLLQSMRGDRSP